MGKTLSCFSTFRTFDSKVHCTYSIASEELSDEELAIIQKHWSIVMRNVDANGYVLFSKLFQNKDVMAKFDFAVANELDYKKTLGDARLSFHIRRVFQTIDVIISCEHDKEQTSSIIQDIGAIHAVYGLHIEDMLKFKVAFVDTLSCLLKESFNKTAETAWSTLIDTVTTEFMKGVNKAPQQV